MGRRNKINEQIIHRRYQTSMNIQIIQFHNQIQIQMMKIQHFLVVYSTDKDLVHLACKLKHTCFMKAYERNMKCYNLFGKQVGNLNYKLKKKSKAFMKYSGT